MIRLFIEKVCLVVLVIMQATSSFAEEVVVYHEESRFRLIKDNLYDDANGKLYFKTYAISPSKHQRPRYIQVYRNRFGFFDPVDRHEYKTLIDVIDPETWRQVTSFFYRDDENLYCVNEFSSGAHLYIVSNLNPDDLKFLLPNGDSKSMAEVEAENISAGYETKVDLVSWYATDNIKVFFRCSDVAGADAKTFEVIGDILDRTARDENNFYEDGVVLNLK